MIDRIRELLRGPPDEYWLIRSGSGNEREVIERDLATPPDPDIWQIENDDLPPGTYRCQALRDGMFGEMEWSRTIGDVEESREIDELRESVERLTSEPRPTSPADALEAKRQEIALAALNSEEFVAKYGAEIALSAFDVGHSEPSVSFDEAMKHPVGAAIWEVTNDPKKMEELGESFGRFSSSMVDGAMAGAATSTTSSPVAHDRDVDAADDDQADADDDEPYQPIVSSEDASVDLEALGAERADRDDVQDDDDQDGAESALDETMDELEEEIDQEAGEYPNAAETMEELAEAADADDDS